MRFSYVNLPRVENKDVPFETHAACVTKSAQPTGLGALRKCLSSIGMLLARRSRTPPRSPEEMIKVIFFLFTYVISMS
jgi:hypothetical protein